MVTICTTLLTYSMVQSPSWAADWLAASQEIPRISRNPKVHYRTHKRPPPVLYVPPRLTIQNSTSRPHCCDQKDKRGEVAHTEKGNVRSEMGNQWTEKYFRLLLTGFSPVSIIPPLFETRLRLHAALSSRTNARSLWTFNKQGVFPIREALERDLLT